MTIRELFELCFRDHWSVKQYVDSGWAKEVRGYFERFVAKPLGDREIRTLGPKVVRDWHRAIEKKTSANRALEILSRCYTYAQQEELLPVGFNPCVGVKANVERKRQRFATEEELRRIGEELQREEKVHPVKVAYCRLLALTGCRPITLMNARISQLVVHGESAILRLDGKTTSVTGEEDVVVFPPDAFRIVQELPLREDGLLIGRVEYKRFWERITRNAGCPGLWLRDFRRSFATLGLSMGIGIDPIGELLNHRSSQTTLRYAKLLPLARMRAAKTIGDEMGQLLQA